MNFEGGSIVSFPFITGKATQPPTQPVDLPQPSKAKQLDPAGYLVDQPLVDAINVALLLSQPLLLTGEPGTGKNPIGIPGRLGTGAFRAFAV